MCVWGGGEEVGKPTCSDHISEAPLKVVFKKAIFSTFCEALYHKNQLLYMRKIVTVAHNHYRKRLIFVMLLSFLMVFTPL